MNRLVRTLGISALGIALVAAAGCGGGDDKKTIDLGNGDSVTVNTDLPDSFPDDFPIYDGADLQGAVQGEQDGIEGIVATWTTGDDFDDVAAFYADEFEGGPWTVTTEGTAGGSSYWAVEHEDGKVGYVAVSGGDEVSIIATVGDDPNEASSGGDGGSDDGDTASDGGSDDGDSSEDDGSSDDGSSSGSEANLPDEVDVPDDFPTDLVSFPDSLRITSGTSFSANGQATYMVGFYTKDSAQEVADHFEGELTGKGFNQSVQTSDANGVYTAYSENDDGTGTIIVVTANDTGSVEGYIEGVVQVTTTE